MKKSILIGSLFLISPFLQAEDLEDSVRDFMRHGDWADFKIVDSNFGLVFGTRAFTEDKRTETTLAFNYIANGRCQLNSTELIYKLKSPSEDDNEGSVYGNLQVDSGYFKRVNAKVVETKGSEFLFIVVDGGNLDNMVKNGKMLTANFNGYGVVEFSLNGAKKAIENAQFECKNHS